MTDLTGNSSRRTSSSAIEARPESLGVSLAICIGIGLVLALSDAYLRLPLHMPGWRGFIGMGLLVIARQLSDRRWGASAAAASTIPFSLMTSGALLPGSFVYLASGLITDLFLAMPSWRRRTLLIGVAAGLANVAKLVAVLLFSGSSHAHGIGGGILAAVLGHFAFGFCGGALVAQVARLRPRGRSKA